MIMKVLASLIYGFFVGIVIKSIKVHLKNVNLLTTIALGIFGSYVGSSLTNYFFNEVTHKKIYDVFEILISINTAIISIYLYDLIISSKK